MKNTTLPDNTPINLPVFPTSLTNPLSMPKTNLPTYKSFAPTIPPALIQSREEAKEEPVSKEQEKTLVQGIPKAAAYYQGSSVFAEPLPIKGKTLNSTSPISTMNSISLKDRFVLSGMIKKKEGND
eukprot:TRINITY_DN10508_c0_g4_i2.p1 TRINITY_DN10508_c0_g4~~TRINITY_DN10508_c0_g4_i2.p1  ORF type:complete len:126 (+),score=25.60 TRINITY_DN10508_c0_g4_i2:239-616(+)